MVQGGGGRLSHHTDGTEEGVSITATDGDTDRTRISTLSFDPSRPSFSAVYVCVATNPVDSAEANATLTVYGELGNIGDNLVLD